MFAPNCSNFEKLLALKLASLAALKHSARPIHKSSKLERAEYRALLKNTMH
jgi:hypothetical protein